MDVSPSANTYVLLVVSFAITIVGTVTPVALRVICPVIVAFAFVSVRCVAATFPPWTVISPGAALSTQPGFPTLYLYVPSATDMDHAPAVSVVVLLIRPSVAERMRVAPFTQSALPDATVP